MVIEGKIVIRKRSSTQAFWVILAHLDSLQQSSASWNCEQNFRKIAELAQESHQTSWQMTRYDVMYTCTVLDFVDVSIEPQILRSRCLTPTFWGPSKKWFQSSFGTERFASFHSPVVFPLGWWRSALLVEVKVLERLRKAKMQRCVLFHTNIRLKLEQYYRKGFSGI